MSRQQLEVCGAKALDEDEARIGSSRRAFARTCPLSAIDCLITDNGASTDAIKKIRDAGVEVVVV